MLKKVSYFVLICVVSLVFSCSSVRAAEILEIQGVVEVKRSVSDKEIPAFQGMKLEDADRIRTGEESRAMIKLSPDTRAILASGSEISVAEMYLSGDDIRAVFSLEKGGIGNIVDEVLTPDSKYEIKTPTAVLGIRGTEFYVQLESGKVRVWLAKGNIEMEYRTKDGVLSDYTDTAGVSEKILLESPACFTFPEVGEEVDPTPDEFTPDGLYKEFLDSPVIREIIGAGAGDSGGDGGGNGGTGNENGDSGRQSEWEALTPAQKSVATASVEAAYVFLNEVPADPEYDETLYYVYGDTDQTVLWHDIHERTTIGPMNEREVRGNRDYKFRDGVLTVASGGKFAYYDNTGQFLFELDQPVRFKEGVAIYNSHPDYQPVNVSFSRLIDKKGSVLAELSADSHFHAGHGSIEQEKHKMNFQTKVGTPQDGIILFYNWQDGKVGAVNLAGEEVIPPAFDAIYHFSEGLAVFRRDDKYGYIDSKGNVVIEPIYQYASMFDNGVAKVSEDAVYSYGADPGVIIDGNFFYIDYEGRRVEESDLRITGQGSMLPRPSGLSTTKVRDIAYGCEDDSLYLIKVNDLYGYQDKFGTIVIEPKYVSAAHFSDGLAAVKIGNEDKFGFINRKGETVIEPKYDVFQQFRGDVCVVGVDVGSPTDAFKTFHYGLIDRNGEIILEPKYELLNVVDYASREIQDAETANSFFAQHPEGRKFLVLSYASDGRRRLLLNVLVEKKELGWIERVGTSKSGYWKILSCRYCFRNLRSENES